MLELGPGTGVITAEILNHGIAPERLTVIEYDSEFAAAIALLEPIAGEDTEDWNTVQILAELYDDSRDFAKGADSACASVSQIVSSVFEPWLQRSACDSRSSSRKTP